MGNRLSQPIDCGLRFVDGRRLLGQSKTIRGALLSVALATAAAPLLGLEAAIGALVGAAAMLGDLLSSFLKRRLGFDPSSRLTGLDQIPESLLPLLACREPLSLGAIDILAGVGIFSVVTIVLSPIFYRVGIRDKPF